MQLRIFKNYETLSLHAADEIIALVKRMPHAVLCLASGDTPRLAYSLMVEKAQNERIDFANCTFVALDEWIGIPPDNVGSCHYFLTKNIFGPLNIALDRIHMFNGLTADPQSECRRMNDTISEKGGIDLMLVGIGMNGHIGFNEPGESIDLYSHVVELDETTKIVGQKYFTQQTQLTHGITLGLKHLLESRTAFLIANGSKKAEIIKRTLEEEITPNLPATIIRQHANGYVMIDSEAASSIKTHEKVSKLPT